MTKEQAKFWKQGFDSGVKNILYEKEQAIKIGEAILNVLDERYEFAEKDY